MGNSLHNKIYLGRRSPLASRGLQAVLAVGLAASMALAWVTLRFLR